MKIALTGSSGFIASTLKSKLFNGEVEFVSLNRHDNESTLSKKLNDVDVVINLAGAPVIQRWTSKNKNEILLSRLNTTKRLVTVLNSLTFQKEVLLISASAIGIYPDKGEVVHDESSEATGSGFLSNVVGQWENEALQLKNSNVRLVIARIGVVLGEKGGLLKKTLPLFRKGFGGKIASGKQALSFIHVHDIVNAFQFFIENKSTQGIYNIVAPNWVKNIDFTNELGQQLNRPVWATVPAFALKFIYGKAAKIMINGEKVFPQKLLNEGFVFTYPTIDVALSDILNSNQY